MAAYILAGVGNVQLFDSSGNLILTAKTLTESSFSINVSSADIRGGLSNPLLGKYFYDSVMDATLTDALFSLEYLSLVVGGDIIVGGEAIANEEITTATANQITVQGTPVAFGDAGVIGWYSLPGKNAWTKITFTGKTATVTGLASGTKVCVRYNATDDALREFTVPAAIIPAECHMVLTAPLFAAGSTNLTSSSQAGELIVDVPRFLLSGATDLSMTSTGASTTNLSGSALATFSGQQGCNDLGYYAKLKEKIYGKNWYDGLQTMAVDGADIQMTTGGGTHTVKVIGIYEGGATGTVDNANLTFTSGTQATCTVANGVITPVATGTSLIKIVATGAPEIECYAQVTVTV